MKHILLVLLLAVASSCSNHDPTSRKVTYFQDGRTKLCFAVYYQTTGNTDRLWNIYGFANVPCSGEEYSIGEGIGK